MSSVQASLEELFSAAHALLSGNQAHQALLLAQQACVLAPDNADCINLLGVCAMALGDGATAEQCWRHAIASNPLQAQAQFNLAQYYSDTGHPDAEQALRASIALIPEHAGALARLAQLLAGQKRNQEAEAVYRRLIALQTDDHVSHARLALLLEQSGRHEEAEANYRKAMALAPDDAETHANLALLLEGAGRFDEALAEQREALELMPASAGILSNMGNLLGHMGEFAAAENAYRRAIAVAPAHALAHANLGVLLAEAHRDAEAERQLRHALILNPDSQRTRLNLAMLLLTLGKMAEGWLLHEARYHPDLPEPDAPMPRFRFRQWRGEALAGKSLLVWPEQGYGDMIQFCRYLPELKRHGARRIDLVCRAAQLELLRSLEGVHSVTAIDDWQPEEDAHDFWTLPMSLPLHCATELATIPADVPYLASTEERRARWAAKFPEKSRDLRIGLTWRGNPFHANDRQRSLPGSAALAPLWAVEGVQLFALQGDNMETLPDTVTDLGSGITDFADTAAILDQLDLLITVDTAIAHLAGALGKPCWVMLPASRTDWRWMRERSDSPWYPGMRLIRQQRGESWGGVVQRVANDLRRIAERRRQ